MDSIIWEIIHDISKLIQKCDHMSQFVGYPDATPEQKAFQDVIKRILGTERDNFAALIYLYNQAAKDKPSDDTMSYAKETVTAYREEAKLIK